MSRALGGSPSGTNAGETPRTVTYHGPAASGRAPFERTTVTSEKDKNADAAKSRALSLQGPAPTLCQSGTDSCRSKQSLSESSTVEGFTGHTETRCRVRHPLSRLRTWRPAVSRPSRGPHARGRIDGERAGQCVPRPSHANLSDTCRHSPRTSSRSEDTFCCVRKTRARL